MEGIHTMYNNVCPALNNARLENMPTYNNHAGHFMLADWSDHIRAAQTEAHHAYGRQQNSVRSRQGRVCELMRTTRFCFKNALSQCQAMQQAADMLAKRLSGNVF